MAKPEFPDKSIVSTGHNSQKLVAVPICNINGPNVNITSLN